MTELFGLGHTVTLYDLTNTFFEGEAMTSPRHSAGTRKRSAATVRLTLGLVRTVRVSCAAPKCLPEGRRRRRSNRCSRPLQAPADALPGDGCGDHRGQRGLAA